MNTTIPQYTPETGEGSPSLANFTIQKFERELNEARDQLNAMREAIKEAHEALDWATSNMNPPFAWEPFKKANATLTKLQPFLP